MYYIPLGQRKVPAILEHRIIHFDTLRRICNNVELPINHYSGHGLQSTGVITFIGCHHSSDHNNSVAPKPIDLHHPPLHCLSVLVDNTVAIN